MVCAEPEYYHSDAPVAAEHGADAVVAGAAAHVNAAEAEDVSGTQEAGAHAE